MMVYVFTLYTSIYTSAHVETANARFDIFGNVEHRALSWVHFGPGVDNVAVRETGNEGDITVASPRRTGPRVSISGTWKGRGSATSVLRSRIVCRGQIDSAPARRHSDVSLSDDASVTESVTLLCSSVCHVSTCSMYGDAIVPLATLLVYN